MTPSDAPTSIGLRTFDMPDVRRALDALDADGVLRQLVERGGRMAELATEAGDVKLDWIDGVQTALERPETLYVVASEAVAIVQQGIRHIIWAGMGGSVQTVYCLKRMGFLDSPALSFHPLDSTDPASLNRTLHDIAAHEGLDQPAWSDESQRKRLLASTMMIGVSMGMTSEEPITHLEWFDALLQEAGVDDPGARIQVMTLPGSYLDAFARQRGSRMTPIQLNGANHTPGRMSAPATRVFLRPVALSLAARELDASGVAQRLHTILSRAASLGAATSVSRPSDSAFVRLGAILAELTEFDGRNKVLVQTPEHWSGFAPWLEQLVEESLGKGGKGLLIFHDQDIAKLAIRDDVSVLRIAPSDAGSDYLEAPIYTPGAILDLPVDDAIEPAGLAEVAAAMLGFQLLVATFGYQHGIVFAGQPAVEGYKKYARELRDADGPLTVIEPHDLQATDEALTVDLSGLAVARLATWSDIDGIAERHHWNIEEPSGMLASLLALARTGGWFRYLDFTYNGELSPAWARAARACRQALALNALGLPCKVRTGPSDYHSTEQSETDGPFELVSIRVVALSHEPVAIGPYTDRFLLAQARGTWQAMVDAGRWVVLVSVPNATDDSATVVERLLEKTADLLVGR